MFRQGLVARDELAPFVFTCDEPPLSHVHNEYVLNAGYEHLANWVAGREQPPTAPLIETTGPSTSPTIPRRPERARVRRRPASGRRCADRDQHWRQLGASVLRSIWGHLPFSPDKLSSLYPSHDSYVDAVSQVTRRNLKGGFILKEDAEQTISDATNSPLGTAVSLPIP